VAIDRETARARAERPPGRAVAQESLGGVGDAGRVVGDDERRVAVRLEAARAVVTTGLPAASACSTFMRMPPPVRTGASTTAAAARCGSIRSGASTTSTAAPARWPTRRAAALPAITRRAAAILGTTSRARNSAASTLGGCVKLPVKSSVPSCSLAGSSSGGTSIPKGLTRTRAARSGAISATVAASSRVTTWRRSNRVHTRRSYAGQRRQSDSRNAHPGHARGGPGRHSMGRGRRTSYSASTAGSPAGRRKTPIALSSIAATSNDRAAVSPSIAFCTRGSANHAVRHG